MENPVYQDLSWNTYNSMQNKDFTMLENKRTHLIQVHSTLLATITKSSFQCLKIMKCNRFYNPLYDYFS